MEKLTKEDEEKCSTILQDMIKKKRHMTNEEWMFFIEVQYLQRYFCISEEYFQKIKNKNKNEIINQEYLKAK